MLRHGEEVMGSNPSWVKLGVCNPSVWVGHEHENTYIHLKVLVSTIDALGHF